MKFTIPLLSLFLLINFQSLGNTVEVDSLLKELKLVMEKREQYDEIKEKRVFEIKKLLKESNVNLNHQYVINKNLIKEYYSFSFDSTLHYIKLNQKVSKKMENEEYIFEANLELAYLLASSRHYKQAEDILQEIALGRLTPELKQKYYNCYVKIYSDLDYFALDDSKRISYREEYLHYADSIAQYIDEKSDEFLYAKEWKYLEDKRYKKALSVNAVRLAKTYSGTEKYSYITFQRAMIYEMSRKNRDKQKKYLILSAISDIKSSRKDNASLAKLAYLIYNEGDVEKSYELIKFSFEDALFYNSKVRYTEIGNIFSIILDTFQLYKKEEDTQLKYVIIIISVLVIGLIILSVFLFKQMKKIIGVRDELKESNEKMAVVNERLENTMEQLKVSYSKIAKASSIKTTYIGNFVNIYAQFIDKLDNYRLDVKKLVTGRKYQQLLELAKDKENINEEIKNFHQMFDTTFLNIYPNFIEEVNKLLEDDQHIVLENGEILNTELRILALIRLGIKDSAQIAHLLKFSVNTIYNYRAKVKGKAKGDRKEFEKQILKIGASTDFNELPAVK
ncbi:DUF6377 domain-containing protein [Flammeovirga sp. SJP92]|uniref:DUF6377 domain-containing protein n=1 Tax=Flammeovirga sp. SJP92 TaxID=1775430 RepID=UPI000787971A|nr:DUF6377 domain-containing protein [Flammeovirga sp. SJP92]KXX67697.1 hypothetical protein AVL50_24815 [Flammeovirga sp. SJP92]